jgi:hypothetical protein
VPSISPTSASRQDANILFTPSLLKLHADNLTKNAAFFGKKTTKVKLKVALTGK